MLRAAATTSFPAAVRLGLDAVRRGRSDPEWVWLLHDDANPDPGCLAALLAAAEADPDADLLGPKLREWPSLRRLLELGVTISGTGRRETGLERGEYDQGQHDEVRTVLAVNTAGMLVRRRVLESLGGLDEALPLFGNDIDLGWRAAEAGHRTIVVPQAVVFHAEAAHRGLRRTPLTGRHTHYQERRAALFTLLANAPAALAAVPHASGWPSARCCGCSGFLLVRAVGRGARRARRPGLGATPTPASCAPPGAGAASSATHPPADVRELLAPRWLPYRHGLDFLGDLVSALSLQASDVAERRRLAAAEADPSSFAARRPDARRLRRRGHPGGGHRLRRALRHQPGRRAALARSCCWRSSAAARPSARSSAAGSPRCPRGSGDWWRLHLSSWHEIGSGTAVPTPAYVLPLALLAHPAARQRHGGRHGGAGARRAGRAVGRLALPARASAGWSRPRAPRAGWCCSAPRRTPWCR